MKVPRPRRYGPLARYYDVLSGERMFYRAGRQAAVDALDLGPGGRVLDVGCGTGLTLPLLVAAVGPAGQVVGVDASAAMLARARSRVDANGWSNVELRTADAGNLADGRAGQLGGPFDAVIFAYSLSIIDRWREAWAHALTLVRPGGRVAVVDTAYPVGAWSVLSPLAWVAFAVGGVHPARRVWELVGTDARESVRWALKGGHVHVAVGTVRAVRAVRASVSELGGATADGRRAEGRTTP